MPYCNVHCTEMPTEEDKCLEFSVVSKQIKVLFVIYANYERNFERHLGCQLDPSKSSTIKLAKHVPSEFTSRL